MCWRTNPIAVADYATVAVTSGVMINGIIKIGFSTIGIPKITGSLILNIPGTIQVLANAFEYFDRPNTIIANTSPNVAPEPPIHINHWYNGSGDMNGNRFAPLATASPCFPKYTSHNGRATVPTTDTPWIPNDQKNVIKNTGIITPK